MEERRKHPVWKICIEKPFRNCRRIFPIQQKKVKKIIQCLEDNDNVLRIIVFGSSVTTLCHIDSDVDLYVELEHEQGHLIREPMDFVFDLWTNYTVDERMLKEIRKKGVVVYEKDDKKIREEH